MRLVLRNGDLFIREVTGSPEQAAAQSCITEQLNWFIASNPTLHKYLRCLNSRDVILDDVNNMREPDEQVVAIRAPNSPATVVFEIMKTQRITEAPRIAAEYFSQGTRE